MSEKPPKETIGRIWALDSFQVSNGDQTSLTRIRYMAPLWQNLDGAQHLIRDIHKFPILAPKATSKHRIFIIPILQSRALCLSSFKTIVLISPKLGLPILAHTKITHSGLHQSLNIVLTNNTIRCWFHNQQHLLLIPWSTTLVVGCSHK